MVLGRSIEFDKQKELISNITTDPGSAHKQKELVRCNYSISKELTKELINNIYVNQSITKNLMTPENPSATLHKTSITRQEVKEIKSKL